MINKRAKEFLVSNAVTLMFVILCVLSIAFSGRSISYVLGEAVNRLGRNSVLILSLVLPVLCGMGLNFSIVIGAMAGEIALLLITHWHMGGVLGFLVAGLITVVLGGIFGFLVGSLLNKTVGQEMITGIILGYFAIGLFDLTFLILLGRVIPFNDPNLMLESGVGLKTTIAYYGDVKQFLDNLWMVPFDTVLRAGAAIFAAGTAGLVLVSMKRRGLKLAEAVKARKKLVVGAAATVVCAVLFALVPALREAGAAAGARVPMGTWSIIIFLCLLTAFLIRTKLGQDIRTIGQSMDVALVASINVKRGRLISIIFSTIIAGFGQIIFLQNMGSVSTFSSHEQVGQYAIAALLVGGASIKKANIGHVFLGAALFHILFFTSPLAGMNLFGDPQIGEYFRMFLSYAVITVSLVLYGFKQRAARERALAEAR